MHPVHASGSWLIIVCLCHSTRQLLSAALLHAQRLWKCRAPTSIDPPSCVAPQDAKSGDKQLLNSQCEPLLTVAEAHAEGKESFARSIATELFSDFLSVEERFAANKEATEQEVIDSLRQVSAFTAQQYT